MTNGTTTEFIEIPDFDFSAFYYPDFIRSLTIFNRQNVPEITDESDEEPFTQLTRAFALVGHLNNVLLDVIATETLLPTARLLESVRSHLRLIDVVLDQAKPAAANVVFELSALFTTPVNFVPTGTQVATVETDDTPQILFEADGDNIIDRTDIPGAVFGFNPAFVQFLSNVFHLGDTITVESVDFEPNVDFSIGATLVDTIDNFVEAVNASSAEDIEDKLLAFRVGNTAYLTFLSDDLSTVTVSIIDNTLETTLVDQTTGGTDADLTTGSERRADEFTMVFDRTIKNVTYSLKKTGAPTGNVRCSIEIDDSGNPSGTIIASSTNTVDISTLTGAYVSHQFDFASTTKLDAGEKYWFILETIPPLAEEAEIQIVDGVNAAVAEIADTTINNDATFFDVVGSAKYWLLDAQDGSLYYIWYNVTDGANIQINPAVAGRTSVQIDIVLADLKANIATKTISVVNSLADFGAVIQGTETVRITQANAGDVNDPINVNAGVTVSIVTPGVDTNNDYDVNGTGLHWLLDAQDETEFYIWYFVSDGNFIQTDPALVGKTGIQVTILEADGPNQIATKTAAATDTFPPFDAVSATDTVTVTQVDPGDVPDAADVDANVVIVISDQGFNGGVVSLDSSGADSSTYYSSSAWGVALTSLVMKIIADSTNFTSRSGGFSLDVSGQASTPGLTFPLTTLDVVPGSIFYIMHSTIMWNGIEFTLDTNGLNFTGVWEFYDGNREDTIPDLVTNLGSNLEFDLTNLLGTVNRTGAIVEVKFTGNGVSELRSVFFESGTNLIRTVGLLGQVTVSTEENEYIVGTDWNEVPQLNDGSQDFTQDGTVKFELPQDLTRNWIKKTINTFEGFPLRYRIVSVSSPTTPVVDLVDITADKQFILFEATQGESKTEDPLGTSDGSENQQFELAFSPLIVESLVIEVDEGTGFTAWNLQDNFLTSTQISKDYTLEVTAEDIATITFGDGQNGKTPAGGVDNIRASYRIFSGGTANNGNVGARTISVNKSGIAFVSRVFNPRQAIGFEVKEGSTDADLARLKIAGPASLRVRNRAITPDDFEFLATEFTTSTGSQLVTRALAIEETFGIKTLELVVVGSGGGLLTGTQLDDLSIFFNGSKPDNINGVGLSNHEATAINYTPEVIDITATVTGGNAAQIENALKALLNPEALFDDGVTFRWDFDDTVPLAIIIAEIISVDPVNIKNVNLISPVADIDLGTRELPSAGTLNITVL